MGGRPNLGNKAAFSNFSSGIVRMLTITDQLICCLATGRERSISEITSIHLLFGISRCWKVSAASFAMLEILSRWAKVPSSFPQQLLQASFEADFKPFSFQTQH